MTNGPRNTETKSRITNPEKKALASKLQPFIFQFASTSKPQSTRKTERTRKRYPTKKMQNAFENPANQYVSATKLSEYIDTATLMRKDQQDDSLPMHENMPKEPLSDSVDIPELDDFFVPQMQKTNPQMSTIPPANFNVQSSPPKPISPEKVPALSLAFSPDKLSSPTKPLPLSPLKLSSPTKPLSLSPDKVSVTCKARRALDYSEIDGFESLFSAQDLFLADYKEKEASAPVSALLSPTPERPNIKFLEFERDFWRENYYMVREQLENLKAALMHSTTIKQTTIVNQVTELSPPNPVRKDIGTKRPKY